MLGFRRANRRKGQDSTDPSSADEHLKSPHWRIAMEAAAAEPAPPDSPTGKGSRTFLSIISASSNTDSLNIQSIVTHAYFHEGVLCFSNIFDASLI
jgi:hypothetical protein